MASARDLVTVLFKPRETMRRILDEPKHRWTAEVMVLAAVCAQFGDRDIRDLGKVLPSLGLAPTLATVALALCIAAIIWVAMLYIGAWLVTLAGRVIEGNGKVADVRAAIAWSFVPVIWSFVYRIPFGIYASRVRIRGNNAWEIVIDVAQQGVLSVAFIYLAFQFAFDIWVLCLASANVAEAMKFETWRGFSAVAMVAAVPFVMAAAAVLAFHH